MKKLTILGILTSLFFLTACMTETIEITNTSTIDSQITENPSTSEMELTENTLDITSVINYLYIKEFYPENLRNIEIDSNNSDPDLLNARLSAKNNTSLLSDTTTYIYPEDIYIIRRMYAKRTQEFRKIYTETEAFKEELQYVLPYTDKFGEFIKLEDQNFYFKIVLEGENIEDGINYYSVDLDNLVYVYMHNYFIEENEYIELSVSRPIQSMDACDTCMGTYTYYNYNDTELKLIEMIDYEYWDVLDGFEDIYIGKYVNPSIFEYKLLDNGSYETTYMYSGYNAEMDENYRIIPSTFKRNAFTIETYREFEDGSAISVFQTNGNFRNDIYMTYYPNVYKPYLDVQLLMNGGVLSNVSFHPFVLNDVEYLDCEVENREGFEVYIINSIVTQTNTLYFNGIKPEASNFDGMGYQISIGSQQFEGNEAMLTVLREFDTAVDFDWLFEYSSMFYEEYSSASVLGLDIFSMSVDTWEKYLDINFFVNYEAFTNQFEQFDTSKDYIPPIIYAPEVIEVYDYGDIESIDFTAIITAFDDIDGEIAFTSIDFDIHHENDIITYILLTVEDESGNISNHLILVKLIEENVEIIE